jgi:hypothetical protein
MKTLLLVATMALSSLPSLAAQPPCAAEAQKQARKLLIWHSDGDERAEIEPAVRAIAPLANLANKRQSFSVVEVMGYIYKASYRMRLIYGVTGGQCLLMGQEIPELSSL